MGLRAPPEEQRRFKSEHPLFYPFCKVRVRVRVRVEEHPNPGAPLFYPFCKVATWLAP